MGKTFLEVKGIKKAFKMLESNPCASEETARRAIISEGNLDTIQRNVAENDIPNDWNKQKQIKLACFPYLLLE